MGSNREKFNIAIAIFATVKYQATYAPYSRLTVEDEPRILPQVLKLQQYIGQVKIHGLFSIFLEGGGVGLM